MCPTCYVGIARGVRGDAVPCCPALISIEVGGVGHRACTGELGHKRHRIPIRDRAVATTARQRGRGLVSAGRGGKVAGSCSPSDIAVAIGVHRDAASSVILGVIAAQVGGVNEAVPGGAQLRNKGIPAGAVLKKAIAVVGRVCWLERVSGDREVGRSRGARDPGTAGGIYSNRSAAVPAAAAKISGVNQSCARGIQLCHHGDAAWNRGRFGAGGTNALRVR